MGPPSGGPWPSRRAVRWLALGLAPLLWVLAGGLLARTAAPGGDPEAEGLFFGAWRTRHLLLALAIGWCSAALLLAALSPRALARFLAVNASLACVWLVLEAGAWLGLFPLGAADAERAPEQLGTHAIPNLDVRGETREDLALAWKLPSEPLPYHFKTDRRGFRNARDHERADVYCLGDSFLVAGLVPAEELVSSLLERALDRPVVNLALVGLAPQEERELLVRSGLELDGRLVLHFIFEGNDLRDSARWRRSSTEGPARPSWKERTLTQRVVLFLQELSRPRAERLAARTGWIGGTPYRFHWLSNSFRGFEAEVDGLVEFLDGFRREVEAAGGRYAVILVPAKIRVLGPFSTAEPGSMVAGWRKHVGPLPERLAAWGAEQRVAYLDLTEALRASAARGEIPWLPADTHWNGIGHRVAARSIVESDFLRAWSQGLPVR